MTGEGVAGFPSASAHSAALAARALHAEADDAPNTTAVAFPVGVDADGTQPYVVGLTTIFWEPVTHNRSIRLLGGGVTVAWPL